MTRRESVIGADVAVSHVLLALAASQIVTREAYHRAAAEAASIVLFGMAWVLLVVSVIVARRWLPLRYRDPANRVALLAIAALSGHYLVGGWISAVTTSGHPASVWQVGAAVLVVAIVVGLLRLQPAAWAQFRKLILIAAVLFVGSQPILTRIWVDDVAWPPARQPAAAAPQTRTATIFLLLDELNASSSAPLAQALRDHGLKVRERAVLPVADGTAKVIPAMFTGRNFDQARPCGLTTICSGTNVLDFGRVVASRDDIDVVGFFHPYCAIQGLRSCHHVGVPIELFEADRWRCAAWRRIGIPRVSLPETCDALYARGTNAMREELVEALWRAPVWQRGGLLYAHLPIPHPPGTANSNLQRDYRENLDRAVALLRQMLARAKQGGVEDLRVVIFSDHPLRQALWCRSYFPYTRRGCVVDKALEDATVPLIVAGEQLPEIDAIETNAQVFSLVAGWSAAR